MAVFDVAQHVVNASAGLISGSTAVDASTLDSIRDTLEAMEVGPLLGLFLQSLTLFWTKGRLKQSGICGAARWETIIPG